MGRGDVQQADKRLNEYIRQENIPAELEQAYPNISKLLGSQNFGQSDVDKMTNVAKSIRKIGPYSADRPYSAFDFLRRAEDKAGMAYAQDIAKTTDPDTFSNFLKQKDKVNYKMSKDPSLGKKEIPLLGYYVPNEDYMKIDPSVALDRQLATLLHEHGHATDTNMSKDPKAIYEHAKNSEEVPEINPILNTTTASVSDLDAVSKLISGKHFKEPGSNVLNQFLKTTNQIAKDAGVTPDYENQYQDIRKLLGK